MVVRWNLIVEVLCLVVVFILVFFWVLVLLGDLFNIIMFYLWVCLVDGVFCLVCMVWFVVWCGWGVFVGWVGCVRLDLEIVNVEYFVYYF